jgi:hypothetical protein
MGTRADIRRIFETKLNAFNAPKIDIQFENKRYKDITNVPYCMAFLLMADPENPEMRATVTVLRGIFQINLRYPSGDGAGDIDAHAQALADYFKPVQNISINQTTVVVNKTASVGNGMLDGDRYQIPVKVPFYCIVT